MPGPFLRGSAGGRPLQIDGCDLAVFGGPMGGCLGGNLRSSIGFRFRYMDYMAIYGLKMLKVYFKCIFSPMVQGGLRLFDLGGENLLG